MPTRNVVLTEQQAGLIDTLITSGGFQNAAEVVLEGLRLVEARVADDAAKLSALRAAAEVGTQALAQGDYRNFADADALGTYLNRVTDQVLAARKGA